jgi:hypothetical protein
MATLQGRALGTAGGGPASQSASMCPEWAAHQYRNLHAGGVLGLNE